MNHHLRDTTSNAIRQKAGYCALCRSRCGATYTVEDGVLTAAGPNPEHPTGAALCVKGKAAPEILYSPDRILYPMRRTTSKSDPDPKWEQISWEEALEETAARLSSIKHEHGAEAVAFSVTSPSGSTVSDGIDWIERFIRHFGSPNTAYATELCNWHKDHAHKFTFGTGLLYPEYANADTIFLWGFNPSSVWLDQATQVAEARARGATVVAVDPRDAGFARDADHWLRVLPGTDAALALGFAKILIEKRGYDDGFIRHWTNAPFLVRGDTGRFLRAGDIFGSDDRRFVVCDPAGNPAVLEDRFDADKSFLSHADLFGNPTVSLPDGLLTCRTAFDLFAERCSAFTLERVEAETSVPAERVAAAASALIDAKAVAYYAWTGVGQHANATQTDRAIATLMALKGCYDAPGGNVAYTKHPTNPATGFHQFPEGQLAKALGVKQRPLGPPSQGWVTAHDLYSAILDKEPYPVRGLMVFGANLAVSHPETARAQAALAELDFHVHCDAIETPTARFADIFLPVNTMWEREGLRIGFEVSQSAEELIQLRQPIVEALGEARSDTEIVFDLACRIGMGGVFFDGDIDAALNDVLKPTGVSISDLRLRPEGVRKTLTYRERKYAEITDGKARGFNTDTGRVEIYSELFLRHGYDPLPHVSSAVDRESSQGLILTTAKSGYYTHSSQRHIASLRKRAPEPVVQISPYSAQAQGLEEGDLVQLKTDHGDVRMTLKFNSALHPSVAVASYGWWQANDILSKPGYNPFSEKGANYNRLISGALCDPISGAPAMRSTRCRLLPVCQASDTSTPWRGFTEAEVIAIGDAADDVKSVSLRPAERVALPDYAPGQHITVRLDGLEDGGKETRSYSLTGTARDPNREHYTIAVRRVLAPVNQPDAPPGRVSNQIHDGLKVGDTVLMKAPSGTFTPPETTDDPVVLVAGGIGITPFISYLETVACNTAQPRIHLVYANRNRRSHAFADRLTELKARIRRLSVLDIYDRPDPEDVQSGYCDKVGFVDTSDILHPSLPGHVVPLIYQCGPPAMMDAVERLLDAAGHPAGRLFRETFVSLEPTNELPTGPFTVEFSKSGLTVEWNPQSGSILQLGDAAGLDLARGCQVGQCESCVQRIVSGKIVYRTDIEFDEAGHCLACQAVPASDLVLDA